MKNRQVLLILPEGTAGTGGGTYSQVLAGALARADNLDVSVYKSEADLDKHYDIVHAVDLKHFDPALTPLIKSPLVVDVHDVYWLKGEQRFPTPDLPLRWYLDAKRRKRYAPVLKRADAVIAHSGYVASRIGHRRARVVGYAVEPLDAGPPLRERPPVVVFAGRDYFRKGLPVLVGAWKYVSAVRPDAVLYIAGREYAHGKLYARIAALQKTIKPLGDCPREKLLDIMRNAAAVVLPSWTEAYGIVLIEAAAMGTPAIASRVGGMPEALKDGKGGIIVEKARRRALARAILRCLAVCPDRELEEIARFAKNAADEYTIDKMVRSILDVYDEVAQE